MGTTHSSEHAKKKKETGSDGGGAARDEPYRFHSIGSRYESLEEVQRGLRRAGVEGSNLILGIDFTISNVSAGKRTFGGRSLHDVSGGAGAPPNPYQRVISTLGRTLEAFDDDRLIPCYGFGDQTTKDHGVFALGGDEAHPSVGFEEVLWRYQDAVPRIALGGPTSFAPIIRKAIEIVRRERSYHILVIVADGEITPDTEYCHATSETRQAIVDASAFPLSIIIVGVGDGPWDAMREFDEQLPDRKFDNLNFAEFARHHDNEPGDEAHKDASFAVAALQEIPEQYTAIRRLGLL